MSKKAFLSALLIAFIVFGGLPLAENLQGKELNTCAGVLSQTQSSEPISAPAIEWQRKYEKIGHSGTGVEAVNNLIQTSDGGYAFTSRAWSYQETLKPSTFYKADSSGNLEWNKTIPYLAAQTLIQTNDEGYEIAGDWSTYGTTYQTTPTLIKTDSQGNIQWVQNYSSYSSVPDFGINSTFIQTSDGGYAYLQYESNSRARTPAGGIVKTDSNYNIQWVINLTYVYPPRAPNGTFPLHLFSLIETSDGALAGLGVGLSIIDNPRMGDIYLIKTEAFLPVPSQTPLPTPIPTPTPTPLPALTVEAAVIVSLMIAVAVGAGLLVYFKKRKH